MVRRASRSIPVGHHPLGGGVEFVDRAVGERGLLREAWPLVTQQPPDAIERDPAQRDDNPQVGQQGHLPGQVREASLDLGHRGLIRRGDAAADGCDENIVQAQAIFPRGRRGLVGAAGPIKCAEQEVSRTVAGEHPPRAIRTMRARCQPHDQHPCSVVAKPRHRFAPVRLIPVSATFDPRHLFPPIDQPWALVAGDDLGCQGLPLKRFLICHGPPADDLLMLLV